MLGEPDRSRSAVVHLAGPTVNELSSQHHQQPILVVRVVTKRAAHGEPAMTLWGSIWANNLNERYPRGLPAALAQACPCEGQGRTRVQAAEIVVARRFGCFS